MSDIHFHAVEIVCKRERERERESSKCGGATSLSQGAKMRKVKVSGWMMAGRKRAARPDNTLGTGKPVRSSETAATNRKCVRYPDKTHGEETSTELPRYHDSLSLWRGSCFICRQFFISPSILYVRERKWWRRTFQISTVMSN